MNTELRRMCSYLIVDGLTLFDKRDNFYAISYFRRKLNGMKEYGKKGTSIAGKNRKKGNCQWWDMDGLAYPLGEMQLASSVQPKDRVKVAWRPQQSNQPNLTDTIQSKDQVKLAWIYEHEQFKRGQQDLYITI